MKLSCADFTFPLLPHSKVLQLIRLLGIEAVDLGIFEDRSHHYPSEIAKDPEAHAKRLLGELEKLEMSVADVFVQTGAEPSVAAANTPIAAIRDVNRDTMRRMVEFTVALGCGHLTGLPGVRHADASEADDWQRMCEEAAWRVELCRDAGLTYAVEPHVGSITPDPASTLRMIKDVPGLTLTLDYGHFIYQGMSNDSVHPLLSHASHFHARGGAKGQLQSTVKDNAIDFDAIVRRLKQAGYDGYTCLEYVYVDWEGCNRADNVSESLLLRDKLKAASQAKGEERAPNAKCKD